jgi:hypothetical protein
MPVSEATGWGRPRLRVGGERFSRLRFSGESLRPGSGESRHPFQPPAPPSCCSEVHELPSEGTSEASPQIASVSSDRSRLVARDDITPDEGGRSSPTRLRLVPSGVGPGPGSGTPTSLILRPAELLLLSDRTWQAVKTRCVPVCPHEQRLEKDRELASGGGGG